jgi:hypothetical protein
MMSTCCSKNVEAWNKYIKKERVKLVVNQKKNKGTLHEDQFIHFWSYFTQICRESQNAILC